MRKVLYLLIISSLFFVPLQRLEIKHMLPVKAIAVYKTADDVAVELDSGLKAYGSSVPEAVNSLKHESLSVIYLKTAVYLFVADDVTDVTWLETQLKSNAKVFRCNASGRVEELANYLDTHGEITKIHERKTK